MPSTLFVPVVLYLCGLLSKCNIDHIFRARVNVCFHGEVAHIVSSVT